MGAPEVVLVRLRYYYLAAFFLKGGGGGGGGILPLPSISLLLLRLECSCMKGNQKNSVKVYSSRQ